MGCAVKCTGLGSKLAKSAAIYILFVILGFGFTMLGPTLVTMEKLLDTDMKTLSWCVTCVSIGGLIGAGGCALFFDRTNKEIQLTVAALVEGGACVAMPFTGNVYFYLAVVVIFASGHGFVNSAGNAYALLLWKDHGYYRPFMQSLHAIWCVGALTGPVIIRQFLVNIDQIQGAPNVTSVTVTPKDQHHSDVELVKFAYVTIGTMMLALASTGFVLFLSSSLCKGQKVALVAQKEANTSVENKAGNTLRSDLRLIILMIPQFCVISTLEGSFSTFISPFTVKYLGWDNRTSAMLVSLVLTAYLVSRVMSIFITTLISPGSMLTINMLGMIATLITMCFVEWSDIVTWATVAMAGLFLATTFPTIILWASSYINVSGRAMGLFVVAMQLSGFVWPPVFGHILTNLNGMLMVYVLLALAVIQFALFCLLNYCVKRQRSRREDVLAASDQVEMKELQELKDDDVTEDQQTLMDDPVL